VRWLNTAKYAVVYNVVYTLIYTVLKSYQSSRKVVYMSTHQWGLLTGVVCGSRAGPDERKPDSRLVFDLRITEDEGLCLTRWEGSRHPSGHHLGTGRCI